TILLRHYKFECALRTASPGGSCWRAQHDPQRRGLARAGFFTCHAPADLTLAQLIAVAGTRWAIKECLVRPPVFAASSAPHIQEMFTSYRHAEFFRLARR